MRNRSWPAVSHWSEKWSEQEFKDKDKGRFAHNLELYGLSLELNCPDLEVDANGADVALCVCVVGEPQKKTRLERISWVIYTLTYIIPSRHQSLL